MQWEKLESFSCESVCTKSSHATIMYVEVEVPAHSGKTGDGLGDLTSSQ